MHLDNWLFILLIAVAALFRLLVSKASDAAKKQTKPPPGSTIVPRVNQPVQRPPADTDEERIRRFLEALGQPTSSSPPTPVAPRPTYQKPVLLPRRPPIRSPLPPLTTRPPDLPKQSQFPTPSVTTSGGKAVGQAIEAEIFEIQEGQLPSESPTQTGSQPEAYAVAAQLPAQSGQPSTELAGLIGSPAALRNAIILREIFGPPRGLQPFDFLSAS